jgi:thiamine biosynthesis lipoprotein ApbE
MAMLILKRAPRGLSVMPHFACSFFIAFASVAAGCSAERAQQDSESMEMGRQLTTAYYSCVRTSFASQLPTMVDRNMAIDQAFMVCRTEESKLQAFENTLSENPNVSNAAHRNKLKEELLRR